MSFDHCVPKYYDPFCFTEIEAIEADPCNPSPCGPNAQCRDGTCTCLPEFQGDPYTECRPECVLSSDCSRDKACMSRKCRDPCPGTCGSGAICSVVNHVPICSCPEGTNGNAFVSCASIPIQEIQQDVCQPSPCGPNSQCRSVNNHDVCSCAPGFVGSPPTCRPECVTSSECSQNQACVNQKCRDPCPGTCGFEAICQVVNHNPICSCPTSYTGDPFRYCSSKPPPVLQEPINPCYPTPCGPNSQCRDSNGSPSCSCLPNYIGSPPQCRAECVSNSECPNHLACINEKCRDPCPGSCGSNAQCRVVSHAPNCQCVPGYNGDPFTQCSPIPAIPYDEPSTPCTPSPCGSNAVCREQNGAGACSCFDDYIGNPYEGCRPECVQNSDCPSNQACVNNKCKDPCPGTCGRNAECRVIAHLPNCACLPGMTGDAYSYCSPIPPQRKYLRTCFPKNNKLPVKLRY